MATIRENVTSLIQVHTQTDLLEAQINSLVAQRRPLDADRQRLNREVISALALTGDDRRLLQVGANILEITAHGSSIVTHSLTPIVLGP